MTVLLVIHIIIVVCLIGVILMQRSSQDGFTGAGGGNSLMSGRASATLLTRVTSVLAALFLANSLLIAYLASHSSRQGSIADKVIETPVGKKPGAAKPEVPAAEERPADAEKAEKGPVTKEMLPEKNPAEQKPAVPLED